MNVTVTSILGNQPKTVKNTFNISSVGDVEKMIKACITDKVSVVRRQDGLEVPIISNGCVYTEVFNQKNLLVDWCNLTVDEFPVGGEYAKSSI